jgi:hypothetical protein
MSDLDATQTPSIPAWKLRMGMKKEGTPMKRNSAHNIEKLRTGSVRSQVVDPNLPPAFRAVFHQRAAFSKQQARRKNNDEFVSMNSSHPDRPKDDDAASSTDSDSMGDSFASMGEDISEGEEEVDISISEDEEEDDVSISEDEEESKEEEETGATE